jgi:hypothetical protein
VKVQGFVLVSQKIKCILIIILDSTLFLIFTGGLCVFVCFCVMYNIMGLRAMGNTGV